jgi:aspartate carbamoyltransferase catalytic subunit
MNSLSRHVLTTREWRRDDVEHWFRVADEIRANRTLWQNRHCGAVVATLFYEPSTRTRLSFEAAAVRLGAHVVSTENAKENTSAKKGESLADVFRIVGAYTDAIIIRHHETGELERNAKYSPVPVINAGSGAGEHPTQALLDLYTIWREHGRLDDITLCLMGDLKYGRTVHSLLDALGMFHGIHVKLFHPQALGLPDAILERARVNGIEIERVHRFTDAAMDTDVLYQTRIQEERLCDQNEAADAADYWLTMERMRELKASARILHPLPRVGELHPDIDLDERAAYFRQAENGLYVRMALLHTLLANAVERTEEAKA